MRQSIRQTMAKSSQPPPAFELDAWVADMDPDLSYDMVMLDEAERAIRVLEVEAEMNEAQAKRFAELASYITAIDHKMKLEALSAEALEKAVAMRSQIRLMREHQP